MLEGPVAISCPLSQPLWPCPHLNHPKKGPAPSLGPRFWSGTQPCSLNDGSLKAKYRILNREGRALEALTPPPQGESDCIQKALCRPLMTGSPVIPLAPLSGALSWGWLIQLLSEAHPTPASSRGHQNTWV